MTGDTLISGESIDTVPASRSNNATEVSGLSERNAHFAAAGLRWFFIALALLALMQGVLNYVVNPLGAFGSHGYLRYDIRASDAYNKTHWLDAFLDRNTGTPVALALGSSRVMALPPEVAIDGMPFFNAGIPGGKGEDILAFSRYVADHPDVEIGQVIISLDPAVFRNIAEGEYGLRVEGIDGLESELDDRIARSARVRSSIAHVLGTDWAISLQEQVLSRKVNSRHFDRASGVRQDSYFEATRLKSAGSRSRLLRNHIDSVVNDARTIEWSKQREDDVRAAVRLLSERGAVVTLVLMPYNSTLLDELGRIDNYRDLLDSTRLVMADLQQEFDGVISCDLADASNTALNDDLMWWDGYHYTSQAAQIVADEIQTCVAQGTSADMVTHAATDVSLNRPHDTP